MIPREPLHLPQDSPLSRRQEEWVVRLVIKVSEGTVPYIPETQLRVDIRISRQYTGNVLHARMTVAGTQDIQIQVTTMKGASVNLPKHTIAELALYIHPVKELTLVNQEQRQPATPQRRLAAWTQRLEVKDLQKMSVETRPRERHEVRTRNHVYDAPLRTLEQDPQDCQTGPVSIYKSVYAT